MLRLVTATFLLAVLVFPVTAGSAQPLSCALPNWTAQASAPQTGLRAYTSGRASVALNTQSETAPADAQAESNGPDATAAQTPPLSKVLVLVDKSTQEMKVFVGDAERYTWQVSTGLPGYDTPSGNYAARSMNEIWYSKEWDDAPMPHAIFFTKKGHAALPR